MSLPSVTQIIGAASQHWSIYDTINPGVLEAAAVRGSAVHLLCCCYARQVWTGEVPENCKNYFTSFKGWFDAHVIKVHLVEEQLTDLTRGFTGTPDLIVTMRGDMGGPSLWDIKTPTTPTITWPVQVAAYRHLALMAGHRIIRSGCLRLHPKGGDAVIDEYSPTYYRDLNVFMSMLNIWNYFIPQEGP